MIKQFVPQEICLRCQGCCRFKEQNSVWSPCLLDEEIQDLVNTDIPKVYLTLDKRIEPVPNGAKEGETGFVCPFLNLGDNKCKIYARRPFECQLYPFLINLRGKKIILTADLNCRYVQEKLNTQEFKEYAQYLSQFLNSPAQIKLLKENPQILQAYEEVSEIVELK
ncbi:MAG: YkgJ family cysteine cluster protein [Candidatus Omnitrophota bacterium]|nr:YkgJ family cysteine cluster protein [Candidatus Omnitrophota bacterium]